MILKILFMAEIGLIYRSKLLEHAYFTVNVRLISVNEKLNPSSRMTLSFIFVA